MLPRTRCTGSATSRASAPPSPRSTRRSCRGPRPGLCSWWLTIFLNFLETSSAPSQPWARCWWPTRPGPTPGSPAPHQGKDQIKNVLNFTLLEQNNWDAFLFWSFASTFWRAEQTLFYQKQTTIFYFHFNFTKYKIKCFPLFLIDLNRNYGNTNLASLTIMSIQADQSKISRISIFLGMTCCHWYPVERVTSPQSCQSGLRMVQTSSPPTSHSSTATPTAPAPAASPLSSPVTGVWMVRWNNFSSNIIF